MEDVANIVFTLDPELRTALAMLVTTVLAVFA